MPKDQQILSSSISPSWGWHAFVRGSISGFLNSGTIASGAGRFLVAEVVLCIEGWQYS